jgi:hypothetical protein
MKLVIELTPEEEAWFKEVATHAHTTVDDIAADFIHAFHKQIDLISRSVPLPASIQEIAPIFLPRD